MRWHIESLGRNQVKALKQLGPWAGKFGFYLGGGTAIALYLGHRKSADLDWFTNRHIPDPLKLASALKEHGIPLVVEKTEPGTLHGFLYNVRISFFEFHYPLLERTNICNDFDCPMASLKDLACMKLSAVAQRGSVKDFLDIYAVGLKDIPLKEMIKLYTKKFSVKDISHLFYGLAYFDDAERERMPRMLWNVRWRAVRETIASWIKSQSSKVNI